MYNLYNKTQADLNEEELARENNRAKTYEEGYAKGWADAMKKAQENLAGAQKYTRYEALERAGQEAREEQAKFFEWIDKQHKNGVGY